MRKQQQASSSLCPEDQPSKGNNEPTRTYPQQPEDHDEESKQLCPGQESITQVTEQNASSFGNNLVLVHTKPFTIFLGPDYCCFIATFLIFLLFSYFTITFVDSHLQSQIGKIFTKIVCFTQCLSYFLVAFSDPGVVRPSFSEKYNVSISGCRFCRLCRFKVPVRSYHCSYCDVCIEGYDHHCPWTSKCIGKNNLGRFYFFLFMTPVFIVYCSFVFGFTIQDNNMAQLQALSRH